MRPLALTFCALLIAAAAAAKNGAYSATAHGDKNKGPQRLAEKPRGSCVQCHDQHVSHEVASAQRNAAGLFAPNDNDLCFTCHATPSESGIFAGNGSWMLSSHATSPADTGKCVNCHDPHGTKDAAGLVPALLDMREPALCLECHDGSRGADIRSQLTRSFRHGMDARGKHDPAEGSDPAKFASLPATNRHVSCSDCHNAHRAVKDRVPPAAPAASSIFTGVSRIEVANGAAGTAPRTTWRGADDPTPASEYEICFKCHSSWTKLGPGQPDLALLTNPANPSFHPIQAAGKNAIDPQAFAGGMSAGSIIACTDCHGSDDETARGLHGSSYRSLLKRPSGTTERTDICFACHAYDVYGRGDSPADVQRASRFNAPSASGHAFHVATQQIACAACHETHGSTRRPALITTGRAQGIISFTQTANGGTCASTCHGPKTYGVNYGR
jgi:predicted CXXCH cytochrome family protein